METRNRSRSNRELEYEISNDIEGPPIYDPTAGLDLHASNSDEDFDSEQKHVKNKSSADEEYDSDDEEEGDEEIDEDELPRTRARSRSVLDAHEPQENEKGITIINPIVIGEISSQNEIYVPKPLEKIIERKGPLQIREVEALQKVNHNLIWLYFITVILIIFRVLKRL
jgi:hypothetical protein